MTNEQINSINEQAAELDKQIKAERLAEQQAATVTSKRIADIIAANANDIHSCLLQQTADIENALEDMYYAESKAGTECNSNVTITIAGKEYKLDLWSADVVNTLGCAITEIQEYAISQML